MLAPFSIVIFGATGDLALRKLIPGLFKLYRNSLFPDQFRIIGLSRRGFTTPDFRYFLFTVMSQRSDVDRKGWENFVEHIEFMEGKFEDDQTYNKLSSLLSTFDKNINSEANKMLYLATPPNFYETILERIHANKLSESKSNEKWVKILIEKPFGKDLDNAKKIDNLLNQYFKEDQIYRVDHYLGKDTVQNIVAFRFANGIFDPVWNNNFLDHVQVTLAESNGIGGRGAFYDGVGALRDVTQNHLMQLLSVVTMEQPGSFSADGVREARADAIKKIRCIEPNDVSASVIRGQYASGVVRGSPVAGYRGETNVDRNSTTETFIALKVFVDSQRFENVPFYIRTGKRLPKDAVEISLVFKQVCHLLFREIGCPEEGNILTIRIQPNEGISTRFIAKEPGLKMKLTTIDMEFSYREKFKSYQETEAYERILQDAFLGDQMLFNRSDELVASWTFISKIMEGWSKLPKSDLYLYDSGTWGPTQAQELIKKDGRKWVL